MPEPTKCTSQRRLLAGAYGSSKSGVQQHIRVVRVTPGLWTSLGKREDNRNPLIQEFVPLAGLDDLVFGGWDPLSPNALEAARTSGVMKPEDLAAISGERSTLSNVSHDQCISKLVG